MSATIDKKVVEMQFNNAQFEKNVSTSMNSINNLKKNLNTLDSVKNIDTTAFSTMASNIQSIADRFSTLGIVGMRVIEKLTDAMMNLATKTLSFFTNGIIQGGIKRATNLENAHFQLQGLLKDEQEVAGVMKNVNDAVDGTAYSLDAAAVVASQLAASGMRAGDNMYKSLKAVAGVAAMTNSSYEDIGHIFTTVAGNGRLMTEQLNQFSYKGLNAAATLAEQFGVTESEIREMVHDGKINFQMFADAMDSAFGEHAKKANETFNGALSNIRAALGRIGALFVSPLIEQNGPLVQFLNTVRERINDIKKNIVPLAEMVTGAANKILTSANKILKNVKIDSNEFEIFRLTIRAFGQTAKNVFEALLSVLKPVQVAFKRIFPQSLSLSIVQLANHIKFLSENLKLSTDEGKYLRETFKGIFSVIKLGIDIFKAFAKGLEDVLSRFTGLRGSILENTAGIGNWLVDVTNSIRESGIESVIGSFAKKVGEASSNVVEFISSLNILEGIGNVITKIFSKLGDVISGAGSFIKTMLSGIGEGLASIFQNGNTAFAINASILAAVAYNIKNVFVQIRKLLGMSNPFSGIGDTLGQVRDTLFQWEKELNANYFLKIGGALLMLAAAFLALSSIDSDKLTSVFTAVTILMGELIGTMYVFSRMKFDASINKASKTLIKFSAALLILAVAVKMLSSLNLAELATGLGGVTVLLGLMVGTVAILSSIEGKMTKCAGQLIGIAIAITILSAACKIFASMNIGELAKGLGSIAILLLEIVGFMALTKDMSLKGAGSILVMAMALTVLAGAVAIFGHMSLSSLAKGFIALALGLTILAVAMNAMQTGIAGAAAMLIMSAALAIFTPAMLLLSTISWEGIAKSMVTLAGTFVIFGVAGLVLGPLIPVLISLSGAIALFGVGILAAGAGIAAFGVGLTAIATALAIAGPMIYSFVESMLSLIPLFIQKIGEGIVAFIGVITSHIQAVCDCFVAVITAVCEAINIAAPTLIDTIFNLLTTLLQTIAARIPEIIDAGATIIIEFLDGMAKKIPLIVNSAVTLISNFITAIGKETPRIIDAGFKMVISFLNGLADAIRQNSKQLGTAMGNVATAMIQGLVNGLFGGVGRVVEAARDVASRALNAAKNFLGIHSPSTEFAEVGKFSDIGLANGLTKYSNVAEKSASKVGKGILNTISDSIDGISDAFNSDVDLNPVIAPVLDLTNVQSGSKKINGILDNMSGNMISLNGATSLAGSLSGKQNAYNGVVINMTINGAEGQNVNQLAELVSERINNTITRRANAWA